jgi:hypothetical protein
MVSEAGSGTPAGPGTISPDENPAVAEVPDDIPAKEVSVDPDVKSTVKSIVAFDPTAKSARKAAFVPLTEVTVNTESSSNCGVLVPSFMPTHVTVPVRVLPLALKETVSVPPETTEKMPPLSIPVTPVIEPNVVVPVSTVVPLGDWKAAGDVVNPAVEKSSVPLPLLVKPTVPLLPPVVIMSALAADAHKSGAASNATGVKSFLFMSSFLQRNPKLPFVQQTPCQLAFASIIKWLDYP